MDKPPSTISTLVKWVVQTMFGKAKVISNEPHTDSDKIGPPEGLDPSTIDYIDNDQNKPEPFLSSQQASSTNSIKKYAALLKQVPDFELYTYADESAYGHSGLNERLSRETEVRSRPLKETAFGDGSSVTDALTGGLESLNIENMMPVLPRLRDIRVKGHQLLRGQLKTEDIARQMAEHRQAINKEVKLAGYIVEKEGLAKDVLLAEWKKSLSRMSAPLEKLNSSEDELQFQQGLVTLAQNELQQAVNRFYAFLTAGANLSESEASKEDRVYEKLMAPDTTSPQAGSLNADVHANEVHQNVKSAITMLEQDDAPIPPTKDNPPNLLNGHLKSGEQLQEWDTKQVVHNSAYAQTEDKRTVYPRIEPRSVRRRLGKWSELAYCGDHLPYSRINIAIEAAKHSADLMFPASLSTIRQQDLRFELTGMERIGNVDTEASKPSTLGCQSIVGKLDDINEKFQPTHIEDFISLWGANMSQNSWTDFRRSVQYDCPAGGNTRMPLLEVLGRLDATALTKVLQELGIPFIQVGLRDAVPMDLPLSLLQQRPTSTVGQSSLQVHPPEHNRSRSPGEYRHPKFSPQHSPVRRTSQSAGRSSEADGPDHPNTSDKAHIEAMDDRTIIQASSIT